MWPGSAAASNFGAYTDLPVLVTEQEKISASTVRHGKARGGSKGGREKGMSSGWDHDARQDS